MKPPTPATRRRRGLFAILALAFACALLIQASGWAQTSYFALVRSLSNGTAEIDRYHWETRDESYYKGHYYSVKAPGLAFLATPLYEVLDAADFKDVSADAAHKADRGGAGRWVQAGFPVSLYGNNKERTLRVRETIAESTLTVWALGLFGALAPAIVLLLAVRWCAERVEPGFGTAAAMALGVGTLVLPFATLFFGHVLAATLVFCAFALLWKEREGRPRPALVLAAGLLAGFAVTTEYPLAIAGAIIGVYGVARAASRSEMLRRGLVYAAGVFVGVAPLVAYNLWAFGSLTHFSYHDAVAYQGDSGHDLLGLNDEGFFGIGVPDPWVALKLLFAAKGLLVLSPVLVLTVAGIVLLYRRGRRAEALTIGGVAFAYLLYNAGYWLPFGGGTPGPRFLVPMLPFLAVPLGIAFKRFPLTSLALAVPSAVLIVTATITLPLIGNDDVGAWTHLVRVGVFQHTVVSVLGGDNGWPAIAPVLVALAVAIGFAVAATPKAASREGWWPVLAVVAWALVAAFGSRPLSGSEAATGDAVLLVVAAALLALIALAAAYLGRERPWERDWIGSRTRPQRELSS